MNDDVMIDVIRYIYVTLLSCRPISPHSFHISKFGAKVGFKVILYTATYSLDQLIAGILVQKNN